MNNIDFKKARKAKGMTQKELASFLGVSYSAVTKWESDNNPVPHWVAEKMLAPQDSISVKGLSAEEIAEFEHAAAEKGKSPDELVTDLIRMFIKL